MRSYFLLIICCVFFSCKSNSQSDVSNAAIFTNKSPEGFHNIISEEDSAKFYMVVYKSNKDTSDMIIKRYWKSGSVESFARFKKDTIPYGVWYILREDGKYIFKIVNENGKTTEWHHYDERGKIKTLTLYKDYPKKEKVIKYDTLGKVVEEISISN